MLKELQGLRFLLFSLSGRSWTASAFEFPPVILHPSRRTLNVSFTFFELCSFRAETCVEHLISYNRLFLKNRLNRLINSITVRPHNEVVFVAA